MINAIKVMNKLEENGLSRELAETWVNEWLELMDQNFATKQDIKEIVHRMESLSTEFRYECKSIRDEMRSDKKDLEKTLTIRLGGILLTGLGLLELIHKF